MKESRSISGLGIMLVLFLRVKTREALITEIVNRIARSEETAGLPGPPGDLTVGKAANGKQVRFRFFQTVPPDERTSRKGLVYITDCCFTGLASQTGNFSTLFAGACERLENNHQTLAMSFSYFDHHAASGAYPLPDGTMTPNVLAHPIMFESF